MMIVQPVMMIMKQSVKDFVAHAKERMTIAGKLEHLVDVDWLMMAVLELNRPMYLMEQNRLLKAEESAKFEAYMDRRLLDEPLQYILNHQSFYGYDFYVDDRVLIPRFETEELVERVSKVVKANRYETILDLCSGSGCIGLTLLKECSETVCTFVDISNDALAVAMKNADLLEVSSRAQFLQSNLYESLEANLYDVIVSNPPYIETEVIKTLEDEVKMKEPDLALDGGDDGLDFYRQIIIESRLRLVKGGFLFFEIGYNQMKAVTDLFEEAGYAQIEGYKDLSGHDRIVVGRYNN